MATVSISYFEPAVLMHLTAYYMELRFGADGDEQDAVMVLRSKLEAVGSYNLGDPDEHSPLTCNTCLDFGTGGAEFYPVAGTVNIDVISEESNAPHAGEIVGAVLVESDVASGEPVPNGRCYRLPRIAWDFREYDYPYATIPTIRAGGIKEGRRATVDTAVVTASGAAGTYIQQGGGQNSGVILGTTESLQVGDRISVHVRVHPAFPPWLELEPQGLLSRSPFDQVITTVPDTSLQDPGWEGVLVRIPGPFTVTEAILDNRLFTLVPDQGASVLGNKGFFDPTLEPSLEKFDVGARLDSITGIVIPSHSGLLSVAPRDLNDLDGYVPAP